jgi:hypothetical protein
MLTAALVDARIVRLQGTRQVDKRTLVQQLAQQRGGQHLALDDPFVVL